MEQAQPSSTKSFNRRWWLGLALILLVGAVYYLAVYDYQLPLPTNVDELRNMNEILLRRGRIEDSTVLKSEGYPPGVLVMHTGAQLITEAITGESAALHQGLVLRVVRLFSVIAALVVAFFLAQLGRELSGEVVGWTSAALWIFLPGFLRFSLLGLPQTYELLSYVLAAYFALLALKKSSPGFAIASVGVGLVGVLFKYTIFPVLGLGVGVALWNLWRDRTHWRRWLVVLVVQFLLIAGVAGALVASGVLSSLLNSEHSETTAFLEEEGRLNRLLNPRAFWNLFSRFLEHYSMGNNFLAVIMLIGLPLYLWKAKVWQRIITGLILICALAYPWFMVAYIEFTLLIPRYNITISGLVVLLVLLGVAGIADVIGAQSRRKWLAPLLIAMFFIVWLISFIPQSIELIEERTAPVYPALLSRWAAPNFSLEDGTMLVNDRVTFDEIWGYYRGPQRTWLEGNLSDRPLEEWLELYVNFAEVRPEEQAWLENTPEGQEILSQLLLMRQLPNRDTPPERSSYVYRLWRMQTETNSIWGGSLRLVGYDLPAAELTSGDEIKLRLYWQAAQMMTPDYQVFVHLTAADDPAPIAQADISPARASRPTSTWDDLGETLIGQPISIGIPEDAASGDYLLRIGVYDPTTGQRLALANGEETLNLAVVVE